MRVVRWGLVASLALLVLAVPSASAARPQRFLLTLARDIGGHQPPRLVLVDRSGTLIRQIGTAGYVAVDGKWSPDGQSIAWSDPVGVHIEDANGTNQRLLVAHVPGCNTACTQPAFIWTPDGTALDVGGVGQQTDEFLYVPIDGAPPSPLAPAKPWWITVPSFWTQGGNALVWARSGAKPGTKGCCFFTVYETTAATHATRALYRGPAQGGQAPLWSPDATQRIMFTETKNPRKDYDLTLVDGKSGKSRLLPVTGSTTFTVWSPDGRTVATVLSGNRVVTVTLATGKVHEIGRGQQLFYGRDGTLYITRDRYSEVWTSRNSSPETFLFRTPGRLEVYDLDSD
jgi:hypothetical protein